MQIEIMKMVKAFKIIFILLIFSFLMACTETTEQPDGDADSDSTENEVDGDDTDGDDTDGDDVDGDDVDGDDTDGDDVDGDDTDGDDTDGDDTDGDDVDGDDVDGDDTDGDDTDGDDTDGDDTDGDDTDGDDADGDEEIEAEQEEEIVSTGSVSGKALLSNIDDSSGVDVLLLLGNTIIRQTTTDASGNYEFSDVNPDSYTITASWGDFTLEHIVTTEVDVLASQVSIADDLNLTATGNLQGTAILEGAATGNLGIQLYLAGHSSLAMTNDEGSYLMSNVPAGLYQLCTNIIGYDSECLDNIEVLAGQTVIVTGFDLEESDDPNTQYASLEGRATLVGEEDHSGITVSLAGTDISTTTDADGNYLLENIPQGEYDIVYGGPAGMGFEDDLTIYDYKFFAGMHDNALPDYLLNYGRNLLEPLNDIIKNRYFNQDLQLALFLVNDELISFDKVSGEITNIADNVRYFVVSPDWTQLAYVDNDHDLYSIPISGGTEVLLTEDLYVEILPKISPDASWVVYANHEEYLYSIPMEGGTAVKLGSVNKYSEDENGFLINPASTHVLNKSDANYLYTTPIEGGESVQLASNTQSYVISPDLTRVVVKTSTGNLYSIPIEGGITTLIASSVKYFQISPDSSKVVYSDSSDYFRHVPLAGGTTSDIGQLYSSNFQISPDSSKVVQLYSGEIHLLDIEDGSIATYGADAEGYKITGDSAYILYWKSGSLYSIPIASGAAVLLIEQIYINTITPYLISPDSSRVVYITDSNELYSIRTAGGTAKLIGTDVVKDEYKISNNSKQIVYTTNSQFVYRTDIYGKNSRNLAYIGDMSRSDYHLHFPAFDDFSSIFYLNFIQTKTFYYTVLSYRLNLAEFEDDPNLEHASLEGCAKLLGEEDHSGITVSLAGTDISTTTDADGNYLLENIPPGEYDIVFSGPEGLGFEDKLTIHDYEFFAGTHDDLLPEYVLNYGRNLLEIEQSAIVNQAFNQDLQIALLTVDIGKLYKFDKASGELTYICDGVGEMIVSPDWTQLIYWNSEHDLYSIPVDGGEKVLLAENIFVEKPPKFSPDSSRVVYAKYSGSVYSIPIEGGIETEVGEIKAYSLGEDDFLITPDSARVISISLSNELIPYTYDIYSTPIEGGTSVLLASDAMLFQFTPDFSTVVYLSTTGNLYTTPTDEDLAELLATEVNSFQISADATKVVYKSFMNSLHHIPIEGGAISDLGQISNGHFEINPDLTKVIQIDEWGVSLDIKVFTIEDGTTASYGENVRYYKVSPDWNSIICASGSDLILIPLAGGDAVPLCEDFNHFEITKDSSRVVCSNQSFELYSFPTNGDPASLISSDVLFDDFRVSNDSQQIVYVSNSKFLYRTGIDGDNPRIISSLVLGGIKPERISFPAFNDYSNIFYLNRVSTNTGSYAARTYRFNMAEFD